MSAPRVAIIGPGRLGTLLATASARAGHAVVAVAGGSATSRARVRELVAGVRDTDPVDAARRATRILLAVPDDAIEPTVQALAVADVLVPGQQLVHHSGARGLEVLALAARAGVSVAACHPAMTVPAGTTDPDHLVGVGWAVTAAVADRGWSHEWVRDLGGDPFDLAADRRTLYHAALTVGSNAVAAAAVTARQLLHAAGVEDPAALLGPLAQASAVAGASAGAGAVTGPITRGDLGTVRDHLDALDADLPELATRYRELSRVVLATVGLGLDEAVRAELARALEAP